MDTIDWLLEEDAPGVALRTRTRLLGESPGSRRVRALRRRANEVPPVAAMLDAVDDAIEAGDYQKYRGAFWTLIFLAELEVDPEDSRLRLLADHALSRQLSNGGFSPSSSGDAWLPSSPSAEFEIVCLTGNLLRALVRCGYGGHEGVVRGYGRLAERILERGGVPCRVIDGHSLLPSCRMTIPHVLRAFAVAPPEAADGPAGADFARARDLLVGQLLEQRVYRYVRPDAGRFARELVPLEPKGRRPRGTSFQRFRADYLRENPDPGPDAWQPKPGWLRFGFPNSYNPDLLEALLALAELGVPHHPALDDALHRVEEKRRSDGRWRLERSLNGKTHADVERKGRPSKWITLHALIVLRHFGRA